ncbi:hypothetical protein CBW65_02045 [Tumebacillus avium]|uniref:MalT-like TPR region domain-containing protein n=1 Tax=Tumebacillus avium TaxID=1903704 RepID=A0A1Y0IHR0_9BACL|nr:hypothetical protein [Tumebacillus avium]ARU59977.1 hypothetical protein CBW65_02045 [Tumebacillus avium]
MINAYNYYFKAYQQCLLLSENDMLTAKVSYNLGTACRWLRFDTHAKSFLEQAKQVFDKFSDQRSVADTLYVLGIVHKNMKDFKIAGEYIKHSLAIYESLEIIDWAQIAKRTYAYDILGTDRPKEAINVLVESIPTLKENKDYKELALTYARIAQLHLELGELEQSSFFMNLAEEIYQDEITVKSPLVNSYILLTHARYYLRIKKFEKSVQYAFKSSAILDKMKLHKEMADSLQIAYQAYKEAGDFPKALAISEQIMSTLREAVESLANP